MPVSRTTPITLARRAAERGGGVSGTKGQRSQLLKELMALHGWTFFAS